MVEPGVLRNPRLLSLTPVGRLTRVRIARADGGELHLTGRKANVLHAAARYIAETLAECSPTERWLRAWDEIGMYCFFRSCNGKVH